MTQIKTGLQEARDAELSLKRMEACAERAAKLETLKAMLEMGVRLDSGRSVQEIMGRQV